jgi:hypothetical protein
LKLNCEATAPQHFHFIIKKAETKEYNKMLEVIYLPMGRRRKNLIKVSYVSKSEGYLYA